MTTNQDVYQVHCAISGDGYGWDGWVTDPAEECIGDGWGMEPHDARIAAIHDAEFTCGKLEKVVSL